MTGLVGFEAWAALAGDSPTSRTEWAAVVDAWSQPHRRYHDLAHLAAVLGLVDELAGAAADPDAVRLAAWYHDVVYDPERGDNEQVSAERARAGLRGLVPDERIDEVERLVLLTASHDAQPGDANGAVLCDADLAVLERLLELPQLYRLPAVAEDWTPRARANMAAELTLLRSRGAS